MKQLLLRIPPLPSLLAAIYRMSFDPKTIDADLPFEAMVKVMGLAEYPNGFRPVSAKETRMFLSQKGYTGNIAGEEGESILARITGIHVKGL